MMMIVRQGGALLSVGGVIILLYMQLLYEISNNRKNVVIAPLCFANVDVHIINFFK